MPSSYWRVRHLRRWMVAVEAACLTCQRISTTRPQRTSDISQVPSAGGQRSDGKLHEWVRRRAEVGLAVKRTQGVSRLLSQHPALTTACLSNTPRRTTGVAHQRLCETGCCLKASVEKSDARRLQWRRNPSRRECGCQCGLPAQGLPRRLLCAWGAARRISRRCCGRRALCCTRALSWPTT